MLRVSVVVWLTVIGAALAAPTPPEEPPAPPPTSGWGEAVSSASMIAVATSTAVVGARRSLTAQDLLAARAGGEELPLLDSRHALALPLIASTSLLVMYFLFQLLQSFVVAYLLVAAFSAVSFVLYEPLLHRAWPKLRAARRRLARRGGGAGGGGGGGGGAGDGDRGGGGSG